MKKAVVFIILIMLIASSCAKEIPEETSLAEVYAYVSVDINPSVELAVGQNGKVISVDALNDDAFDIIEEDMVGQKLELVLDRLTDNAAEAGLLVEEGTILVTSAVIDRKKGQKTSSKQEETDEVNRQMLSFMERKQAQYEFLLYKGTSEEYRAAKSNGLSLGKYTMMKFLGDVSKEEIKAMKMAEIAERKELREQFKFNQGNSGNKGKSEENRNNGNKNKNK